MAESLICVEGRVQGVGFRAFARLAAVDLGLTGFARNLDDGRVEVLVQGEKSAIEVFIDRLSQGPRLAEVGNLDVCERTPGAAFGSFEVK